MDVQQQFLSQFKSSQTIDSTSAVQRERLIFLLLNLVGQVVEVVSTNGKIFEGIFHTAHVDSNGSAGAAAGGGGGGGKGSNNSGSDDDDDDNFAIVLKQARLKNSKIPSKPLRPIDTFVIRRKDIAQIYAADILFANEKQQYRDESFVTDTEISRRELVERELVPWMSGQGDGGEDNGIDVDLEFESLDSRGYKRGWDQFKLNEQKFGVKSTYEEELYTTHLDKSSSFYREREKEAARLAREIERQSTDNIHLREERGQTISNVSEEELYSSVIRESKYIPPYQRKTVDAHQQKQKQAQKQGTAQVEARTATATSYAAAAAAAAAATTTTTAAATVGESPSSVRPAEVDDSEKKRHDMQQQMLRNRIKHLENIETTPRRKSYAPKRTSPISPISVEQYKMVRRNFSVKLSPVLGPVITSPVHKNALNLDPISPRVSFEVRREFVQFQQQQQQQSNTRRVQFKHHEIEKFRNFSAEIEKKIEKVAPKETTITASAKQSASMRRLQLTRSRTDSAPESLVSSPSAKSSIGRSLPVKEQSKPPVVTDGQKQKEEQKSKQKIPTTDSATTKLSTSVEQKSQRTPPVAAAAAAGATATASVTTKTTAEGASKQTPATKAPVKLNPNAKAFSFNPKAAVFTPGKSNLAASTTAKNTESSSHVSGNEHASKGRYPPKSTMPPPMNMPGMGHPPMMAYPSDMFMGGPPHLGHSLPYPYPVPQIFYPPHPHPADMHGYPMHFDHHPHHHHPPHPHPHAHPHPHPQQYLQDDEDYDYEDEDEDDGEYDQ